MLGLKRVYISLTRVLTGNAQYFDTRTAGCAIEEQDAAIKSAAEKATSELRSAHLRLLTKVTKQHARGIAGFGRALQC
jgi:hypothetical protein